MKSFITKLYESDFGHITGLVYDEEYNLIKVIQFVESPFKNARDIIRAARNGFADIEPAERSISDPEWYANEIMEYDSLAAVIDKNTVTIFDKLIRPAAAKMLGLDLFEE